jgi:gamma-glutamylputrescine oxidase
MDLLHANDRPGVWPPSWYAATAVNAPQRPALAGDCRADVCIVGAGYTGLSAALHLARAGLSVVVLEAHRAGWGASGRNGGQVGSGQRQDQDWIEARAPGDARALWDMARPPRRWCAIWRRTCRGWTGSPASPMPCAARPKWRRRGAMPTNWRATMAMTISNRWTVRHGALLGSAAYAGGELDHGAGHVHPLNFALGLAARRPKRRARCTKAAS